MHRLNLPARYLQRQAPKANVVECVTRLAHGTKNGNLFTELPPLLLLRRLWRERCRTRVIKWLLFSSVFKLNIFLFIYFLSLLISNLFLLFLLFSAEEKKESKKKQRPRFALLCFGRKRKTNNNGVRFFPRQSSLRFRLHTLCLPRVSNFFFSPFIFYRI